MTSPQSDTATGALWWRDAVIYQIYIRSFADSDGDGIGDITGIRSRLPYLRQLGVDALWITPWYPSPMADGGYDVADFRGIHPEFGTLADAEAFIADAHAHDLRVILDIVPNHTSDHYEWFRAALVDGPGSEARSRYFFRTGKGSAGELPPNDWRSVFGGPAWTRVPDGEWYLHLFAPEQPDLNWDNPVVREEFEDVLRFWFDRGVDGFRIDVAHGLVKDPSLPSLGLTEEELLSHPEIPDHPYWDRDEVHEIYRGWRAIADSYAASEVGPRVFVAEAWVNQKANRLARYLRSDELHTAFNFDFLRCDWNAADLRETIDNSISMLADVGAPTTWVLSNHDVTRHVTRYGRPQTGFSHGDPRDGANVADIELGVRRARAAALLMLALPGGAYVYQGEELGLPEVEDIPEAALQDPVWERSGHTRRGRDGCRVPLPWTADQPALGFGTGKPWLPQPSDWKSLSVAAQDGDEDSMLALYRSALKIRRTELPPTGLTWLDEYGDSVLAFTRGEFLCVVNLGSSPVRLPADSEVILASVPLAGSHDELPSPQGLRPHEPPDKRLLPSDAAVWLRTNS